ncbi:MAG: hypothetical protein AABX53_03530 [Nanoarchaeota archaeon]
MHRANIYDTLTKLKERNLVYLLNKDGKQVFATLSTDLIINEEKNKLENLKSAMNYIKTTYVSGQTPKVYALEGINAVKSVLFSLLEKIRTCGFMVLQKTKKLSTFLMTG